MQSMANYNRSNRFLSLSIIGDVQIPILYAIVIHYCKRAVKKLRLNKGCSRGRKRRCKLDLFGNFSFRTGCLKMRCSKSCYLRDLELVDLFDNSVIEQVYSLNKKAFLR